MKKSEALKILGLREGYTEDELKKAHRKKVVENHPDRFQDAAQKAQAEEQTKLINEAHDVLKSGKWDPEYGPRVRTTYTSSPYTSGPYRNPYQSYGGQGAEWVGVDPEEFRRVWEEAAAAASAAYRPPTAEEKLAVARQNLRMGLVMLAFKVGFSALLIAHGNYIDAALFWTVVTYLLLASSRFGGCSWIGLLLLIPIFYSTAGMLEAAAMQGGMFSITLVGLLLLSAIYFDFRDTYAAFRNYRNAKKAVEAGE